MMYLNFLIIQTFGNLLPLPFSIYTLYWIKVKICADPLTSCNSPVDRGQWSQDLATKFYPFEPILTLT